MKKIFFFVIFLMTISLGLVMEVSAAGKLQDAGFTIELDTITPVDSSLIGGGSSATVNNVLTTTLDKLIMVFGVCAVFVMTIGAGYMIIYHGQDEFLSKGKSIFMAGIIALVVALSAGVIVKLFAFLLY